VYKQEKYNNIHIEVFATQIKTFVDSREMQIQLLEVQVSPYTLSVENRDVQFWVTTALLMINTSKI